MSYLSYKPQVRQEGFHLPNQHRQPSPPQMDPTAMFMLPDAFRKFPAVGMGSEHGLGFDFSDELSQLMAGPNAQSMQQPHTPNYDHRQQPSFDDSYRHTTHNIFDISAPLSTSHHSGMSGSLPTPASSLASSSSHYPSSFALQTNRHHNDLGMLSPPNSLQQQAGPLAEFTKPPSMFNSTLPALNSSMRFEPPPVPAVPEPVPQHQAAFQLPPDYRQQHTPSPSSTQTNGVNPVSRSRSRTRAPSNGPGPTRTQSTTRAKRNSVSSSSPPPRPHPSAILIPGATGLGRAQSRDIATSPLALNTGGWFAPEFGLPTPDSMNSHGFNLGRDGSLGPPSAVDEPSPSGGNMSDAAAKQAAIANEKRRRRRESHNAVERRRRDNINEKIGELATLIPECMLDANAPANFMPTEDQITGVTPMPAPQPKAEDAVAVDPSPTPTGASVSVGDETAAAKANKGMILRKSVDYIRYLQQLVGAQASRNRVLESELANYRSRDGTIAQPADGTPGDDFGDLVLHDSMNFSLGGGNFSFGPSFDTLPAVREDMDMDEDVRPLTGMTEPASSVEGQSPSVGDDSDDFDDEPRGRRDRNGHVVDGVDIAAVLIKTEGSE